ncbi:hypothetical protein A2U01_0117416, partial [Trifolium medium]|nr:hypothetical protein [Trifolium medium]
MFGGFQTIRSPKSKSQQLQTYWIPVQ